MARRFPMVMLFSFVFSPAMAAERFETIPTREGVTLSFAVTEPDGETKAAAILFMGGNGKIKLWQGRGPRTRNFLVRTRQLFADRGIYTITVDVASDQHRRGLGDIRDSAEHRADIEALVLWVRSKTAKPLWLIGTSRGAVSVAHLAPVLPVDGAVFASSVTQPSARRVDNVLRAPLDRIRVPAMIVHHRQDDCRVTPAHAIPGFAAKLTAAPRVEVMMVEGGDVPVSGPCKPLATHGFLGIEEKVVDGIVRWMVAQPRPPR